MESDKYYRREDIIELLSAYNINLIVFGYAFNTKSFSQFEELTNLSNDGRIMLEPKIDDIKELFVSIENYAFKNTCLMLETFN